MVGELEMGLQLSLRHVAGQAVLFLGAPAELDCFVIGCVAGEAGLGVSKVGSRPRVGFLPDLAALPDRRLSAVSRELAANMLRSHISELPARPWSKDTALDLRRLLIRQMEEHVERRFHTPALLEAL